jgi:DNA-directed RNA polymerase subunit RPC12/RpoP
MPEKELIISLAELKRAEVKCPGEGCSATVTFDLEIGERSDRSLAQAPDLCCPACGHRIVVTPVAIAAAWRMFQKTTKNATIWFRVSPTQETKAEPPQPPTK